MTTDRRDVLLDELSKGELVQMLGRVHDALYAVPNFPAGIVLTPEKEWAPNTLEDIAEVFTDYGLEPT